MQEATIAPHPYTRLAELLPEPVYAEFEGAISRASEVLSGRTLWNINTTLTGGGVAELLSATLPYLCQAGSSCRWVMIDSNPDYLEVTKRLHNRLHGFPGDEGSLEAQEKRIYDKVIDDNAGMLLTMIKPYDLVVVHDPQPAGLIPRLKELGAQVVWHCHIGTDAPNELTREAWSFLREEVSAADAFVFSRRGYLWQGLDAGKLNVIRPSIDPFSPKNKDVPPDGLLPGKPVITQVARWDRLKDHAGVMRLFTEHLLHTEAHLVLAGPAVDGVSDDPEGAETLRECNALYASLPAEARERIHLLSVPMDDIEQNALTINALQRRSDVIVQKSQAEGFGLVVAEAMWKQRPVVASRVGGIQDQIVHHSSGVLIDDPTDGAAFADAIGDLLDDPELAKAMGVLARQRVTEHFLTNRQLTETVDLFASLS